MHLYRKNLTQRKCSKPSSPKQKKQQALAFLLFRVSGMRISNHVLRNLGLPYNFMYYLQEFQAKRDHLEDVIRQELKRL